MHDFSQLTVEVSTDESADACLLLCPRMADDPKKKKADAKRKSQQPHEVAYRKRKAAGKTKSSR